MPTVNDICSILEKLAPTAYQESYDNAGLLVGDKNMSLTGVLFAVDITEEVLEDALSKGVNMVVAHHPIIFRGLKRLTGADYVQRTVIKALQHNIALYASHTNLDSVQGGINTKLCEKLGLEHIKVLAPKENSLLKLVTFVPHSHVQKVSDALFDAGCGHIGNYDNCSFNTKGTGTFRPLDNSIPFVGKPNELHEEEETRIETILPHYLLQQVLQALRQTHPYEEIAYDVYELHKQNTSVGIGCIGELPKAIPTKDFLAFLKQTFSLKLLRHTSLCKKEIRKVAVCGGSGHFLLQNAKNAKADIFITGDFKYHDFFEADKQLIIADIGHYESEHCCMEIFNELITENLPNFATYFTNVDTNPIKYFL